MQNIAAHNSLSHARPLAGKRIVVTRARAQAPEFIQRLEQLGAEVIEFPTIEIAPPESFTEFDAAVAEIERYDWLIFTSANGVEPFLLRLKVAGKSVQSLVDLKVAAIGPQTAARLESAGMRNILVPARYQAEGILDLLSPDAIRGKRVMIPRAAKARDVLPDTLQSWGARVDVVEAYRTTAPIGDRTEAKLLLGQGKADLISFTSSSTVGNFSQLFGGAKLCEILGDTLIACIGPITAKTVEELGGRAAIVAREFTVDGLIVAILGYYSRESNGVRD